MTNPKSQSSTAHLALGRSKVARWALALLLGVLLVSLSAQIAVPLPFTPVPLTLQGLAVVLVGGLLGPGAGAAALALYLAIGALGVPVFALGAAGIARLLGPTGGYLLAFPLAAATVGKVALRGSLPRCFAGALAGILVIHVGGLAQLLLLGGGLEAALRLGTLPFVLPDLLKAAAAAALLYWVHARLRPGN